MVGIHNMYVTKQEGGCRGCFQGGGCIDTFYLISGSLAKLKYSITSNVYSSPIKLFAIGTCETNSQNSNPRVMF